MRNNHEKETCNFEIFSRPYGLTSIAVATIQKLKIDKLVRPLDQIWGRPPCTDDCCVIPFTHYRFDGKNQVYGLLSRPLAERQGAARDLTPFENKNKQPLQ